MDATKLQFLQEFRPKSASELFGQDSISPLIYKWMTEGVMPQSILFMGPYGCGKTSIARMLASKLTNNEMDIIEINAAEARGIDDVRELQEKAKFSPLSPARVYIIDEIQQMTEQAQSALLKIIEEPPKRIYFFLCTTDPEKLKEALRSRCVSLEVKLLGDQATYALCDYLIPGMPEEDKRTIFLNSMGHARNVTKLLYLYAQGGIQNAIRTVLQNLSHYEFFRTLKAYLGNDSAGSVLFVHINNQPNASYEWLNQYIDQIVPHLFLNYLEILRFRTLKKQYLISEVEYCRVAIFLLYSANATRALPDPVSMYYPNNK